jgi:hypothetical protein
MRHLLLYWAGCVVGMCSEIRGDSWASIPASRLAGRIESFVVARAPDEDVVAVVGAGPAAEAIPPRSAAVVAVDLELAVPGKRPPGATEEESAGIPPEAVWPGPDGRITVQPINRSDAANGSGLRNPWEIRSRSAPELRVSVFASGGVISGGRGGPVALVNGRIMSRGTVTEGFEVTLVTPAVVILRKNGVSYAIPLGRRTSIETVPN